MLKADVPQYLELAESPVNGICDFVLRRAEYRNQVIDYRTGEGKFQHLKKLRKIKMNLMRGAKKS